MPAHRSRGRSLTGRPTPHRAPLPRTRTSTDPAHSSRRTPGVPRLGASSRVSPGGGGGGEAGRRGGATAGGLKAYRSHPAAVRRHFDRGGPARPPTTRATPDPGRRAPQGHHVEGSSAGGLPPAAFGPNARMWKVQRDSRRGVEHAIDRLQAAADGESATITQRSRRAQTPSALKRGGDKPSTWSSIVLGWSYTPSNWCHDIGRIVGYHNVAEHKPSARPEPAATRANRSALRAPSRWCTRAPTRRGRSCPRAVHPRDSSRANRRRRQRARGLPQLIIPGLADRRLWDAG